MKKLLKCITALFLLFTGTGVIHVNAEGEEPSPQLRLLFTQNLNSRLNPTGFFREDMSTGIGGGYAYLASAISSYRTESTVVLDAGNFSMGSAYSALNTSSAPSLTLMGMMGYDAVALGRNELSYGADTLRQMMSAAGNAPMMIASSAGFAEEAAAETAEAEASEETAETEDTAEEEVPAPQPEPYTVIDTGTVKVGVFSVISDNDAELLVNEGIWCNPAQESAQESIAALQTAGADYIVCLAGMNLEEAESFAASLSGVNIVVAGNSYEEKNAVSRCGDAYVVSAGNNGHFLGVIDITGNSYDYRLAEITPDAYSADGAVNEQIDAWNSSLQNNLYARYSYNAGTVVGRALYPMTGLRNNYPLFTNSNLSDLVTDAYSAAYERIPGDPYPVIGITTRQMISGTLFTGSVTASDLFNLTPYGTGQDGTGGDALVRVYMSGRDLKDLCELDCSYFRDHPEWQLCFSHMSYRYSDERMDFNRIIDVNVEGAKGYYIPVTDSTYYPVVMNYSLAEKIPELLEKSGTDLLSISLRDQAGEEITDLSSYILRYETGTEIKAFTAMAEYISRMERGDDGLGAIGDDYKEARDLRVDDTDLSLIDRVRNMNYASLVQYLHILYAVIGGLIALKLIIWLLNRKTGKDTE